MGGMNNLLDLLPALDLQPGEAVEVTYPYLDGDGTGQVAGVASVEADGPCGPPITAEDVFDLPVDPN